MIHRYTTNTQRFKYEKNKIKKENKKNKLEENMMTYNKKIEFNDIKCKVYAQVLTRSFVSH